MIINKDEFLAKYASEEYGYGAYIPAHIYNIIRMEQTTFANVPNVSITLIEAEKRRIEARDAEYAEISLHRFKGMEFEKADDIENALKEYEMAVRLGKAAQNDMSHAYRYCQDRIESLTKLHHFLP